jgi:hypothetical protein
MPGRTFSQVCVTKPYPAREDVRPLCAILNGWFRNIESTASGPIPDAVRVLARLGVSTSATIEEAHRRRRREDKLRSSFLSSALSCGRDLVVALGVATGKIFRPALSFACHRCLVIGSDGWATTIYIASGLLLSIYGLVPKGRKDKV